MTDLQDRLEELAAVAGGQVHRDVTRRHGDPGVDDQHARTDLRHQDHPFASRSSAAERKRLSASSPPSSKSSGQSPNRPASSRSAALIRVVPSLSLRRNQFNPTRLGLIVPSATRVWTASRMSELWV